ncbi:MAG: ArsR/SmtB family transcription factor, partial [Bacillota bacterium]
MSKEIELTIERPEELYTVTKALASEVRIEIIKLLNLYSLNVNEIAEHLNIPSSSAGLNVRVLEEAGLIRTELQPGARGSMKLCSRKHDLIKIILENPGRFKDKSQYISMPIGNYMDFCIEPTCGIAGESDFIGFEDDLRAFYSPERTKAQLIWFSKGYLEYKFPNIIPKDNKTKYIEISAELCSEAPNYRSNWPSDITLWVNSYDCGTWTSPSDFGDRRGKLNPDWWSSGSTQYGILKAWRISDAGSYMDDRKVSDITINDLKTEDKDYISVRFGIMENAINAGGMNLFGEKFGDHAQ